MRKDERICKNCGRVFRTKNNQRNIKYCSRSCKKNRDYKRAVHRVSIGTPSTWSLTPLKCREEVKRIQANKDDFHVFGSLKSTRDIVLENTVYDEEQSVIYIMRG